LQGARLKRGGSVGNWRGEGGSTYAQERNGVMANVEGQDAANLVAVGLTGGGGGGKRTAEKKKGGRGDDLKARPGW